MTRNARTPSRYSSCCASVNQIRAGRAQQDAAHKMVPLFETGLCGWVWGSLVPFGGPHFSQRAMPIVVSEPADSSYEDVRLERVGAVWKAARASVANQVLGIMYNNLLEPRPTVDARQHDFAATACRAAFQPHAVGCDMDCRGRACGGRAGLVGAPQPVSKRRAHQSSRRCDQGWQTVVAASRLGACCSRSARRGCHSGEPFGRFED